MEETLRLHLLRLFDAYRAATEITPGSAGRRAVGDHMIYGRLASRDGSFNVRTYDRLVEWFSCEWPTGAAWPADVPRPARSAPAEARRRNSFDRDALRSYLDRRPTVGMADHAWDLGLPEDLLEAILDGEEPPPEVRDRIETRMAHRDTTLCEVVRAGAAA